MVAKQRQNADVGVSQQVSRAAQPARQRSFTQDRAPQNAQLRNEQTVAGNHCVLNSGENSPAGNEHRYFCLTVFVIFECWNMQF